MTAFQMYQRSGTTGTFSAWEPTPAQKAELDRSYPVRPNPMERIVSLSGLLGARGERFQAWEGDEYAPGAVILDATFGGWEGERR